METVDPRLGAVSHLQPKEILDLLDAVKTMRLNQKGYFAERQDQARKKDFLINSKQFESLVDRKLKELGV
jgi:hypothetical protein